MRPPTLATIRQLWLITLLALGVTPPGFAQSEPANVSSLLTLEQMSANAAVRRNANPYLKRLIDDSQSEVITLARGHGQFVLDEQQWLDIPLETGVTVRARKLHYTNESGMGVWVGEVQSDDLRQRRGQSKVDLSREVAVDPQNLVVLVRNGERITGKVVAGGRQYQIEPVDKGQVAVTRMKLADTPLDDSPASYGTTEKRATGTGERNTQQPIRVLTVYSNDAKLAVADPVALGISHFAYFKEVARASGVTGIYENAGVVNIDYNQPTKNCLGDLPCMNALLSPIGRLSSDMRTQVKAQLVIALLQTDGGLASTTGPVSLDRAQAYASMFDSRTYAHELGHLLGAHHEDGGVPLPYSRGYCQHSIEPYWRTIMGYCGPGNKSIDFYSTPLHFELITVCPWGLRMSVTTSVPSTNGTRSLPASFRR